MEADYGTPNCQTALSGNSLAAGNPSILPSMCEQGRLNTFWKCSEFTRKSEITLHDHFTQAI